MINSKSSEGGFGGSNPLRLRAMMERVLSKKAAGDGEIDPAQELMYQAMETDDMDEAADLVEGALDLDPENVDALLLTVDASAKDYMDELRNIVAIAEKRVGKKRIEELTPELWDAIDARPYMRARQRLADALNVKNRLEEAVKEYNEMLLLDENDALGARHSLLPCLMQLDRLDEAKALLSKYNNDCEWNVVFSWGNVLTLFLSGDAAAAEEALAKARKQNPHMEAYLKGHRQLPKTQPYSFTPGSKEEAVAYAEYLLPTWEGYPEARAWLIKQPRNP